MIVCKLLAACTMLFTAVGGSSLETSLTNVKKGVQHHSCQTLLHASFVHIGGIVCHTLTAMLAAVCAAACLTALQGAHSQL